MSRCYCTSALLADGTCRYGCDPALRAPSKRRLESSKKQNERERVSTRIGISVHDARAGLARVSNHYAGQYADNHDRAKRAWNTRKYG